VKPSEVDTVTEKTSKIMVSDSATSESIANAEPGAKAEADPAKKLKALNKKLREIAEVESKPSTTLTPEQVEKIGKKSAIMQEVEALSLALST
jgi:ribosomal protein S4